MNLEKRITERAQKEGEYNRCVKMGMNVHLYQRINIEYAGTDIAAPYQFHYADLTMDLVRANIRWFARTAENRLQTFVPAIRFPVG